MIRVIENCIPKEQQDFLEGYCSNIKLDWHYLYKSNYLPDALVGADDKTVKLAQIPGYYDFPQMTHVMYDGTGTGTDTLGDIFPMLAGVLHDGKLVLGRMRINMLFPLRDFPLHAAGNPHIDNSDMGEDSFTALYYLNDADGDTIFFNETYKDDIPDQLTIDDTYTPKKGTMIIFNTYHIHSGCLPSKGRRMVININFKIL